MGITDRSGGSPKQKKPSELFRCQHGRFNMDMTFDQTGDRKESLGIDFLFALIIYADGCDPVLADGNILFLNIPGKNVDYIGMFDHKIRRTTMHGNIDPVF